MAITKTTVSGTKEMQRAFKLLGDAFKRGAYEAAAMDMGFMMERAIVPLAPHSTGAYRGSIKTEMVSATNTGAEASVGTNAEQAYALEFGSGLHAENGPKAKYPIEPDTKQMLAFFWPDAPAWVPRLDDGRVILFRVNHPGIEAQPHFRPGFKAGKPKAVTAAKLAFKRKVDQAVGRIPKTRPSA